MYQVIAYERDRYDTCTLIRNHRRMGVKSLHTAFRWLKQYKFAELKKSTSSGMTTIAIVKNGVITHLR